MDVNRKREALYEHCYTKSVNCKQCALYDIKACECSAKGADFDEAPDEMIERWYAMAFPEPVIKDSSELRPCPFCGGEAVYENFVADNLYERTYKPACRIRCKNCKAVMGDFVSEDSTFVYKDAETEAWNRRGE